MQYATATPNVRKFKSIGSVLIAVAGAHNNFLLWLLGIYITDMIHIIGNNENMSSLKSSTLSANSVSSVEVLLANPLKEYEHLQYLCWNIKGLVWNMY